jgi:hypothetical protein
MGCYYLFALHPRNCLHHRIKYFPVSRNQLWYRSTLVTRRDDNWLPAFALVMQRIHIDDLVGYLLNLPIVARKPLSDAEYPACAAAHCRFLAARQ